MDKYKVIIVDDELHQREHLSARLKDFPDFKIIASCASVKEGLEAINSSKPDLVFLDVVMPPETGFDLLKQIRNRTFEVIFTTSYEQFAISAFKVSAVDYILKPFGKIELNDALEKFKKRKAIPDSFNHLNLLLNNLSHQNNNSIALPTQRGFMRVVIEDIIRCEADNMYTTFYFKDRTKHIVSKNIKECEEILSPYHFIRTHLSHLINLNYVKEYRRGDGGTVVLSDGSMVEVSRNRKEEFLRNFKKI
jgi:two-component system LytT family response regulator